MDNNIKYAIISSVHIPVSQDFIKGLELLQIDKFITDDSLGKYAYPFQTIKGYEDFPLFKYIHKSSASKNFALRRAYQSGADIVFIIDSDCIVDKDFITAHTQALERKGYGWNNPLDNTGFYPRGFPYSQRDKNIVLNMGLWTNVLDINGADRSENEPTAPKMTGNRIANGFIPLSGMNLAIRREAIPALFFLPNFGKFKRHDDIFGGYIFQKIAKIKGDSISYGIPFVKHDTIIDAKADAKEEQEMNKYQDEFCTIVDKAMTQVKKGSYTEMFSEFVEEVQFEDTRFEELLTYLKVWNTMFLVS